MPDFQNATAANKGRRKDEAEMNKQKLTILYQRLSKNDPNGADTFDRPDDFIPFPRGA